LNSNRLVRTSDDSQTDENIRRSAAEQLRRELHEIPKAVVSVRKFGAVGDGIHDDSDAIERATMGLLNGGILVFPPGTYIQTRSIRVRSSDVILWGFGALLHGSTPDNHAIIIEGDRSSVIGLRLTAVQTERMAGWNQHRIVFLGDGNQAVANVIDGAAASGIYMEGARHFRVDGNTVRNTLSDGIHATNGSLSGLITHNIVRATGDDLIAVVSYRNQHLASDILIAKNDVAGNPWGRGVAVVGARDVTISDNVIRNVAAGAGVYIAREAFWKTYGTFNVVIKNNTIEHVQTRGEVLGGRPRNKQGAFEIFADDEGDPDLTVQGVLIEGNVVRDALADGVRVIGGVCHVEINNNQFEMLGWDLIRIRKAGCAAQRVSCKRNTLNGISVSPSQCSSFTENITGASVQEK
jgi:polygalacturonase